MIRKFQDAFRGIITGAGDSGIRTQYLLGAAAIIAGIILKLDHTEWAVVFVCIGAVIAAEMFNTCIERLCDVYTEEYDERIGKIKDMAAGAVLVVSLAALSAAVLILMRRII